MSRAEAVDRFLAQCLRGWLGKSEFPSWPSDFSADDQEMLMERTAIHAIASPLAQMTAIAWPRAIGQYLEEEARQQALFEMSHARSLVSLLEALHAAGIEALVMKGTALAYSCYPDPAHRRRGDTDLLINDRAGRRAVRRAFERAGFRPSGHRRALQETWSTGTRAGLTHEIDVHWQPNASASISSAIALDHPGTRATGLPRLSPNARGCSALDCVIQVAINRLAHRSYGYLVEGQQVREADRLIWALDIEFATRSFSQGDWQLLVQACAATRTSSTVLSALELAAGKLGTKVPAPILDELRRDASQPDIAMQYFCEFSPHQRILADLRAAPTITVKLAVARQHLLPDAEFMQRRYPEAAHWPLTLLHLRRLVAAPTRLWR